MITNVHHRAKKDTVLPLGTPVTTTDGRQANEVMIQKGTMVIVSVPACNTDPGIWGSDADEWKPERWLSPLPPSVTEARVPGVYSNM